MAHPRLSIRDEIVAEARALSPERFNFLLGRAARQFGASIGFAIEQMNLPEHAKEVSRALREAAAELNAEEET